MTIMTRVRLGHPMSRGRAIAGAVLFLSSVASGQSAETTSGVGVLLSGGGVIQFASTDHAPIAGAGVTGGVEMVTRWNMMLRAEIGVARFFGSRSQPREECGLVAAECGQETAPTLLSGTAAWVVRPLRRSRQLYVLLGAGFYRATGTWNDNFVGSVGYNGGIGWSLGSWEDGAAIEVRYHHVASNIGLTTGVLPIVVTYRF